MIPRKGCDIALKALAKIDESFDWGLTVIGDGPEIDTLQELALAKRISSKVTFQGNIPPHTVAPYMESHHILLLCSHEEGRPSVVLEAMASAMAVIATDIDGTRELVQDGKTGWLFLPGDVNALATIISDVLRQEKDVYAAGHSGRQWMKDQRLTWSHTAAQYHELYSKVAPAPKSQGSE